MDRLQLQYQYFTCEVLLRANIGLRVVHGAGHDPGEQPALRAEPPRRVTTRIIQILLISASFIKASPPLLALYGFFSQFS